jgi:hypothetical protein
MSYWYQSPYNNRHPKIKESALVHTRKGAERLEAGTIVQPIRLDYLPYDSWALEDTNWDRETHVVCYTEKYGSVIIKTDLIDFSK